MLVCDPRKNALLKAGNKNDRIDARKLSDLLYLNKLSSVYHGEQGIRTLKELARSYITITREKHQAVVALTARAMKGDQERCLAAGMDGYLTKPIRSQELDEILDKYVALRRERAAASQHNLTVAEPSVETKPQPA